MRQYIDNGATFKQNSPHGGVQSEPAFAEITLSCSYFAHTSQDMPILILYHTFKHHRSSCPGLIHTFQERLHASGRHST